MPFAARDNRGASLEEIERVYRLRLREFTRVAVAIARDAGPDAVQDAFGAAIRRRETFRGEGHVEAWLWRFVVNAARDARRERLWVLVRDAASHVNGESPVDDSRLAAAITCLPERQRLVLFLRHYADLDYESIATALGIKRGTVAATLNAAHRRLRQTLQEVAR